MQIGELKLDTCNELEWHFLTFAAPIWEKGFPIYRFSIDGYLNVPLSELIHTLKMEMFEDWSRRKEISQFYHSDIGRAYLRYDPNDSELNFNFISSNKGHRDAVYDFLEKHLENTVKQTLRVVVRCGSGYDLVNVGAFDTPLIKDNYTLNVNNKIKHISNCLNSKDPCGRFVLLSGDPGTGKSYLIRYLVSEIEATWVMIPSNLIGNLAGPELISLITANKERNRPMVLIVEDADIAIRKRENGDTGKLSEILNLGDGLLGELCDIRIIATSNAERVDLDDAITRPGRMCNHIEVGELEAHHAAQIYKRLTGKEATLSLRTLAEVYRAARQDGWSGTGKKHEEFEMYV